MRMFRMGWPSQSETTPVWGALHDAHDIASERQTTRALTYHAKGSQRLHKEAKRERPWPGNLASFACRDGHLPRMSVWRAQTRNVVPQARLAKGNWTEWVQGKGKGAGCKGRACPAASRMQRQNVLPGSHSPTPLQKVAIEPVLAVGTSTAGNEDRALERPWIPICALEGVLLLRSGQGGFRAPRQQRG